jgi:hypothetical protein
MPPDTPRVNDQAEAHRAVEQEQLEERLLALVPEEHRRDADGLLANLDTLGASRTIDVEDLLLRRVGYALLDNRQQALWQLILCGPGS